MMFAFTKSAADAAEGFDSKTITLGSNKQVRWICLCCPTELPHRWSARPCQYMRQSTGCAVSANPACVCNSLESLFPSAADLNVDKNGYLLT